MWVRRIGDCCALNFATVRGALGTAILSRGWRESDIEPFVLALTRPADYSAAYPFCDARNADINNDGANTVSDIGDFVEALLVP